MLYSKPRPEIASLRTLVRCVNRESSIFITNIFSALFVLQPGGRISIFEEVRRSGSLSSMTIADRRTFAAASSVFEAYIFDWGELNFEADLTDQTITAEKSLLANHRRCTALSLSGVVCTSHVQHKIDVNRNRSTNPPLRCVAPSDRETISTEVKDLLEQGVVTP